MAQGRIKLKKVTNRGAFFTFSKSIGFYALEELGDGMYKLVKYGGPK